MEPCKILHGHRLAMTEMRGPVSQFGERITVMVRKSGALWGAGGSRRRLGHYRGGDCARLAGDFHDDDRQIILGFKAPGFPVGTLGEFGQ
jgi:hypothetical protein